MYSSYYYYYFILIVFIFSHAFPFLVMHNSSDPNRTSSFIVQPKGVALSPIVNEIDSPGNLPRGDEIIVIEHGVVILFRDEYNNVNFFEILYSHFSSLLY
jgi:hypothetical protein